MNKYLLLRNNKQSGPYTYEEVMELGLKSQDLLWIEGKSASWRYPAEFDEFKIHPSILKELPVDHTFTNIQNDIFVFTKDMFRPMEQMPEDELSEFPTLALFMDPEVLHKQSTQRERSIQVEIPPPPPVPKPEAPRKIRMIFEGKPISADENDVPLIAPEEPVKSATNLPVVKPESLRDEPVQPAISLPQAPPVFSGRISVTLPAAVSDHTFVVMKRNETDLNQSGEVVKEIASIPAQTNPADTIVQVPSQPAPEINEPEFNAVVDTVLTPVEKTASVYSDKAPAELQTPESAFHFPARTSDEFSSNLMQKLAVAAAIISLLAVFGLLANAILNPDAYNYGIDKKTAPRVAVSSEQISGTNVSEKTDSDLNQQPLNPGLQNSPIDNAAASKSPVQKNQEPVKKEKQTVQTVNQLPPAEQTVAAETGADISPKVEKEPEPDPKEETRRNINSLVSYQLNNYKVNAFGGVSDFEVTINNNSSYPLDLVVVELKYIQSNKKVFKTERLEFRSVAPNGKQTLGVAKTNRGIKVETTITTISSRDLDLSYNH